MLHVLCEPQRPGVVCYMHYVDHRDLGRVLHVCEPHVLCGPQRPVCRDLSRVSHVLCEPQRLGSCVTCIM